MRRFPPRRQGIVLFVVTVVIAALTLGGLSLLALMRVEREATRQRLRDIELVNTARSAAVMTQALAGMTQDERARFGGTYDNPALFRNRTILPFADGGESAFTVLSPRLESTRGGVRYGLVNESTRLNLGTLLDWDQEKPGTAKGILMKLPGMTSIMADSLLDWLDPDEETRPDGAELSYYAAHRMTYSPRNAVPVSLDEILLVRGITRYQLYGLDTTYSYSGGETDRGKESDPAESAPIGSLRTTVANARGMRGGVVDVSDAAIETEVTIPWSRLLTVFSAEKDIDPDGRAKIDLNERDLSFLYDELDAALGPRLAAFVILCRQYGFTSDVAGPTVEAGENDVDLTVPPRFTFQTPLDVVGVSVRAHDRVFTSPISAHRESVTELFRFLDYASVGASAVISGRINVNEAPRAVLELVPGLDAQAVTRILDSRPPPGQPIPKRQRHAAWLFADGIVDLEQMKRLWGKLTTGGDVFRAQIVSFSETGGGYRRAEIVVDAAVIPPRQVFHKDLTMLGRGFSIDVLTRGTATGPSTATSRLDALVREQTTPDTPFGDLESLSPPAAPFNAVEEMLGP
jgi:hypothetical protein